MDKEEPFYDMLINLKTQVDNKLFIHPVKYSLCQVKPDGLVDTIAPINNTSLDEEQVLCMIKKVPEEMDTKNSLKEIEDLPPKEYIHHPNFKATLNVKYCDTIIALLENFIVVIATSTEELTPSKLQPHRIKLKPNVKPFKQRYYRLSKFKSDILKQELAKLIHKRLIEPSYSEWSSPIVLVPKPNGKWRLCIDYRGVNDRTEKDGYPVLNVDEVFDCLSGAVIFTTMDLYAGYHQIKWKKIV